MRSTSHEEKHQLIWEMNDRCDCGGKMSAGVGRGNFRSLGVYDVVQISI
jgi:hypothetical protein